MYSSIIKNFTKSLAIFSFIIISLAGPAFSEETYNVTELINEAEQYLMKGEYSKSIIIYDNILEFFPADPKIHEMKGIALSNIRLQSTLASQVTDSPSIKYDILDTNKLSMLEFYKALQINPNSVTSLNGLGLGFGNFGEYDEAKKYFVRALEIEPNNFVAINYLDYIEKITKKFPVKHTEKPPFLLKLEKNKIPYWIKTNPSDGVIIKYWKEPHKWNLGKYLDRPSNYFEPVKVYLADDDAYVVHYKIFVNEQPPRLPLDHASTLKNSFKFWEEIEFTNSKDGKKIIIKFEQTKLRSDANAWVTWVVKDLGEGVLGHANVGPGVVEVALGGYGCDGSFQLFTVDTVERIMTHELGHSIGLRHTDNPDHVMYPTLEEVNYSYCLLS